MFYILHLIMLVLMMSIGFIFAFLAIMEKDLLKAVIFSAGQAAAYVIVYYLLMSPDIVLAYAAIGVGIYSAVMIIAIKKTERYEKV